MVVRPRIEMCTTSPVLDETHIRQKQQTENVPYRSPHCLNV